MCGFGCMDWFTNKTLFLSISVAFRLLAGVGAAILHVAVYAMAAIRWPDDV